MFLAAALMVIGIWPPAPVRAGTAIAVDTLVQGVGVAGCSLQEAILAANADATIVEVDPGPPSARFDVDTGCPAGSGDDVITLMPGTYVMTVPFSDPGSHLGAAALPIITSTITIEGAGAVLARSGGATAMFRLFSVGPTGDLDLREVHVRAFATRGGNGAGGGGGGMGAGGAIFVHDGALRVQWSTFEGNSATGGDGRLILTPGGGGGGGGGIGGYASSGTIGGGGGGGARGDGGTSLAHSGAGGGGTLLDGGFLAPGNPFVGGYLCGGAGNDVLAGGFADGFDAYCAGGGGGGGSQGIILTGDGGYGGFGGGGGGGAAETGNGGHGGFGGGGGAAGTVDSSDGGGGGDGGFGGGGGAGPGGLVFGDPGDGGTFAGDAGDLAGGGGAGLGGAIFGYLANIIVSNSTFTGNSVERGHSGGTGANDGRGAGGAIFTVAGNLTVSNSTIAANEAITVTNGGGGGIVVYDPEGDDEATLLLRNNIIAGNGAHECYTRNGVDTAGSVGNIVTNSTLNNLGNPACPGVISSADPGLGALALNAPGRTPTMAIGLTSNAINNAVGTVPLDDQRGIARPQGVKGDVGAYEYEAPALLPPTTTIALTPATPNGSNSWYTSSVGVTITASDFDDAIAQTRCVLDPISAPASFDDLPDAECALSSVTADGNHAIYAASKDAAGNAETPVVSATLNVDATQPTLSPTLNVTTVLVGQVGVVASPNASDATSGLASSSCDAVDTSTPGVQTVDCTAEDNAGNTANASVTFVVEYRILGFFSPVPGSKWRAGQTVPIKIGLGNADGVRISDAEAAALAAVCQVTFSATGAQTASSQCLKYDPATDQFVYSWKLKKGQTGPTTITVSISYAGSSLVTTLSEQIIVIK